MKWILVISFSMLLVAFRPVELPTEASRQPPGTALSMADSLDAQTGLRIAPGLDLVKANCVSCHSTKLITQFKATRQGWLDKIRWMQAKQNLWDLGKSEPVILDYLAKNYPPVERTERRPPLQNIHWYKLQ